MGLIYWRSKRNNVNEQVSEENPFPVQIVQEDYLPPQAGGQITRLVKVPGIGTASPYAAGDAFGTLVTLPDVFRLNKNAGNIVKVVLYDLDDEGLQKDLIFYARSVTTTADNVAYAPSDIDLLASVGALSLTSFVNLSSNQIGTWTGNLHVMSQDRNLYVRLVTQGADNIAAGSEPWLAVTVIPD